MSKELMQMNIQRAQLRIEAEKEEVAKGSMRQRYHFMPQAGWMNDPNGLLYYKGKYNFLFQIFFPICYKQEYLPIILYMKANH